MDKEHEVFWCISREYDAAFDIDFHAASSEIFI